nr:unnamed protein product [Callosobruchus chinensis]
MVDPSLGLVPLGSLLEQEGDDIHDNIIFSRIKELAASNLPESWLNWKVHVLTRKDILGTQADPQILNKLSREEASRALANCEEEDADVRSFASASSRSKKTRSSRLDKLERSQAEMKSLLESLVRRLDHKDVNDNASEYYSEQSQVSDDEGYQASQLAPPPSSSSVQWIPPASPMEEDFDFAPKTYEQEPSVPPPKSHIASQGISYQRLGELSFRQIRYTDV